MVDVEGEERHEQVAQGYALHDGPQAQVVKARVALEGIVEPVDEQADDEEQHGALHYLAEDRCAGRELALGERQVARDAHDEQEEGEDKVAGCHAVPLRVLEGDERLSVAVVHQYHACHGEASQDVE